MRPAFVPAAPPTNMNASRGAANGGSRRAAAAPRYTHGHAPAVLRSHTWRTAANSAAYLLPHIAASATCLDVGCGPGTITADLAALCDSGGSVVGVDAARGIVDAAAAAFADRTNLSFVVGDVMDGLPFGDGAFDVVHAHQVLQHVPDPASALREMRRVCKAGGVVAARDADYAGMVWAPASPALDGWMARYQAVARANGGDPDAGRNLLRYARDAGFRDVTSSASVWCFADVDSRAWWGGLWAERVVASDFAGHMREMGASEGELEEMAAAWAAWSVDDAAWFSVVHGEIICVA
jgi:ubiquinone/menaquinone biosynthesis C-methylase UbiE